MPTYILKEAPDSDCYVGWSTVTDSPHWIATRQNALNEPEVTEERLQRTDTTGTSSLWVTTHYPDSAQPEEGSWDDPQPHIYKQRGLITRPNIFTLARRLTDNPNADVTDLLTPLDDETEVRPA